MRVKCFLGKDPVKEVVFMTRNHGEERHYAPSEGLFVEGRRKQEICDVTTNCIFRLVALQMTSRSQSPAT